jgi:hypothetical protein
VHGTHVRGGEAAVAVAAKSWACGRVWNGVGVSISSVLSSYFEDEMMG